ncbi:TlpA disulfide reductase family protein [Nocardioides donggukensis]|uniref:TlpA disulfide reductase family protein n=1 Tax=Nocardioides donggukensis TaxID=2774019 RepID=UPI00298BCB43|nr:TlpA disulfide reductase family protein [Nocardioides donggukensis]
MSISPTQGRPAAALALACLLLLGACSSLEGTGEKGYVSGNGQISELAPGERQDPVELAGEDLDGDPVSLTDLRGRVVVINVWGAWCTDCRKEAPDLVEVAEEVDPEQVAFLGIDARDPSRENARGYVRTFEVPYPSLYDPKGESLLEFRGTLTPNSIPSTVVLDRQGRVAASVLGVLPSAGTLTALIDDVAAEDG